MPGEFPPRPVPGKRLIISAASSAGLWIDPGAAPVAPGIGPSRITSFMVCSPSAVNGGG